MICIDKAVLEAAIDSSGGFRGPNFLDHPPQCTVGSDPGREFVLKKKQDAMTFLETTPSKEHWKDFSSQVFSEINTIAETALLWSANLTAKQRPWTDKHTGRGQTPIFKKGPVQCVKTCDEWTRDFLRTIKVTANELESMQLRHHDRDKARFLVECHLSSQDATESNDDWKPVPLWGQCLSKETRLCSSTTCLQATSPPSG